ncbi:polyprenyl synthetase family protein [Streptomyces erythrochromogenes]|uniref:Polyprenyl synthetase family protein n=1 Tax=Streptomyces erythrochromogenes TaxID=285574 RepID=A0ABZ1QJH4_9ACTN|nr:polyprenyl synthetase family protein [Streptomyces erythrochromogenes]MCX5588388.1 polyprenyl synthetase family protein [Streptomyces erythrochromogenes]
MSYLDLHRKVAQDIDAEIETALDRLGPVAATTRNSVAKLLEQRKLRHPLSVLPLLTHAIETGNPGPALPLSAVHLLWWTSACYLDDLADANGASISGELTEDEALLASVITGNALPIQIILAQDLPEAAHGALITEILNGWIIGVDGQIDDMRGDICSASRKSVVETYRGKSGAPFGMITAMAAIFSGTTDEKVELWREFGYVFGILWQIFNDQEDILSGRDEDLLNGTVTYLLASVLEDASPLSREHILGLCAAASRSHQARAELASLLRAPVALDRYRAEIDGFRAEAYRILDELGGDEAYQPVLRNLVDHASQMLLEADLPPVVVSGAA